MLDSTKNAVMILSIIALVFINIDCKKCSISQEEKAMQQKSIEEVLKTHTPDLMSIPGVVGTAIGKQKDNLCIIIMVIKKTPELTEKIPSTLEGFPVVIQETGEIRALDKD